MSQQLGGGEWREMSKMLSHYKELSPTVKASLWFVVCNVIQKATQILTTPIYTRILTKSQYGEYTVFLSWVEVVAVFTTLDIFYSGYNVGMEKFRDDRETYTTSMHGLCLLLTTVWIILLFPIATVISPHIGVSSSQIKLLLLYMYVFPVFQFWSARKKYDYQYKPLIVVTSISSVGTIALGTILAIAFDNKSDGVIIAKIIVEGLVAIPLLILSIDKASNLFNKFYWKYALKFNVPLVPHYLSTMVLNHSDRLMIVLMCGKAEAAIYSVAYSVAVLMTIIQNAINSAMVPWMYKKIREDNYIGLSKVTTAIVVLMAILNMVLLVIAPEASMLISTSEYSEAVYVIPPIIFGVFLTAVYGLFVNVEMYLNFNKFVAMASGTAAVFNIVLNCVCIRTFGYAAAGYTTFASYLLLTVMHYYGLKKASYVNKLDYTEIFSIKSIVLIVALFAVLSTGIVVTYSRPVIRYCIVLAFAISTVFKRKMLLKFIEQLLGEGESREASE